MNWFDTHIHLASQEYDNKVDEIIKQALDKGVEKMMIPGTDIESIDTILDICTRYPENCFASLGIHPTDIAADHIAQFDTLSSIIKSTKTKIYAIGEVGLDLYWEQDTLQRQIEILIYQIELASELDIPLLLHCRNAYPEMMNILKEHKKSNTRGIFHCFTMGTTEAREVINLDFLLGIGGVLTFKNSNLRNTLIDVGYDKVVLETDGPYLAPVPHRGSQNVPAFIPIIGNYIADIFRKSPDEIARVTTENARKIFGMDTENGF